MTLTSDSKSRTAGLAALVAPLTPFDFLSSQWPKKPLVVHGLDSSIRALRDLPFLQSLDALLRSWPQLVQAHLPDVRDEASSLDLNPASARKAFENQMGLLFNNAEKISPLLREWLAAIRVDLGLPTSTYARCMIYATPHGKGTAAHFDQNVNFVLQLHGTKMWWLSENSNVENPTQRHTLGQPTDHELASYTNDEWPLEQPEPRTKYVLKPGSMLFVPRGMWHSTEADGEALALNFTFSQPTWVDVLTAALRSRLLLSPEWRELADGVTSTDKERRLIARQQLDSLLIELTHDLPNWEAADILAATEGL